MRHRILVEDLDPVDDDAVERVASHPGFDALLDQLTGDEPRALSGTPSDAIVEYCPRRRYGRRLAVAAAAMVVMVGVVAGLTLPRSSSGHHGAVTTPWRAARPFAPNSSVHSTRTGTWRLLDALVTGTWQQNVYGPPPGDLTCPAPQACYLMTGTYASATDKAALLSNSLYVSADAGATWSVLPMPTGFASTTALSCASATWCAVGGTYQGYAVLATSADGGHSFTLHPLPGAGGTLHALSCPSVESCNGLIASTNSTQVPGVPADATFLATTDGGTTFTDEPIIQGESMTTLTCTAPLVCVALGVPDPTPSGVVATAVGAVTTDGGRSWQRSAFPTGFGLRPNLAQPSCATATRCMVLGTIPVLVNNGDECPSSTNQLPSPSAPPMSPTVKAISTVESTMVIQAYRRELAALGDLHCSFGSWWASVSDVAVSSDGGRTWTPKPLPSDVPGPQLAGLACSSATQCWIAGQEQVPQTVGTAPHQGSPVLLGTTDGGDTWSDVTFNIPATAPNPTVLFMSVGSVSCPSARVCVAGGVATRNAPTAPLYRLVIPEG